MELIGLEFVGYKDVPPKKNVDFVYNVKIFTDNNGRKVVEALDRNGKCLRRFVGPSSEDKYDKWANKIKLPAAKIKQWEAPDGRRGTKNFFFREATNYGRLHGLLLSV